MVDLCLALLVCLLALTVRCLLEHPVNVIQETNRAITNRKSEVPFIIPLLFRENTLFFKYILSLYLTLYLLDSIYYSEVINDVHHHHVHHHHDYRHHLWRHHLSQLLHQNQNLHQNLQQNLHYYHLLLDWIEI